MLSKGGIIQRNVVSRFCIIISHIPLLIALFMALRNDDNHQFFYYRMERNSHGSDIVANMPMIKRKRKARAEKS